ncbi:MAG: HAD family phosphatase [Acidobacteria bacterium]|nr:MAG: HAD family phosphatase [Acidobacteriota bacterium]RPJ70376.1 MAG: HAD family phosphatase [Acidobacteriota bacterium]
MVRLIALDIDGTLLDSQWRLPEANKDAIRRATARGIEVALVTGRRFDFARPVIDAIDSPLTLIVSGGALVKNREGTSLVRHLLPAAVAREVLEGTRAYRRATAVVFDRPRAAQVVHEDLDLSNPHRRAYFDRNRDFIAEIVPLEDALTEDPIQVMFSGSFLGMRGLVSALRGLPAATRCSLAITEYESRDFSLVDVNRAGCTKGTTLAEWAIGQGIGPADVMAIGDNLNDREMLEFAGLPVVMGNAVPELRQMGWAETSSNDEAGVAAAIERFALRDDAV